LEHLGEKYGNKKAAIIGNALDDATEKLLRNKKGPSRKVNELDNRGSHFYIAMYWAEALATQNEDAELKAQFTSLASNLALNEDKIVTELNEVQGSPVDLGGYYFPNSDKMIAAMRPSETLNNLISVTA
jgi:isocitrate dehydrogenase